MRFLGARKCPNIGAQIERAIDGAPLMVGGGSGLRGLRASTLVRDRIFRCLGSCLRILGADYLFAMKHGERVELGSCVLDNNKLSFDVWVPHDGIAIDYQPQEPKQVEVKAKWCQEHRLFYAYASPDKVHLGFPDGLLDESYFSQLADQIAERRQKVRPNG